MSGKGHHPDIYDWLPWLRPDASPEEVKIDPALEDRLYEIHARNLAPIGADDA